MTMADWKESGEKNVDIVKPQNDVMIFDAPMKKGNTKWAIKTGQMSGSKLHLLSISNENISSMEACSKNQSSSRGEIANNVSSSSPSIFQEQKMYKRKVDKDDPSSDNMDASPSVTNFVNEVRTDTSENTENPAIPESIFGTVVDEDRTNKDHPKKELSIKVALLLLFLIFAVCLGALAFVYSSFPKMDKKEAEALKFPSNIDDAKVLGQVLLQYKDQYYMEVLGGLAVTYLFLQTFAIPGSIFLSIVLGYLFSFPIALGVICCCSAAGASFCYLLSYLVGRPLVNRYLPQRAANWSNKVHEHRKSLCSYIIFLRITPFLPNWFINVVSPIIGVPLTPFYFGTLIGVAPPSFVCIQAGTTLQQLTSSTDALTFESVALLIIFAFLSLLPGVYRNRIAIKTNLKKLKDCIKNCCRKKKNKLPSSEEPTENSTSCRGATTSEDDQRSCQINNDTSA